MLILVLGSTGFIGNSLCEHFVSLRYNVMGFARRPRIGRLWPEHLLDALPRILLEHGCEVLLVNCIGLVDRSDSQKLYQAIYRIPRDILGSSLSNLDVDRRSKVTVINIGSAAEYGPSNINPVTENHECRPMSRYGMLKCMFANYLSLLTHYKEVRSINLRVFNVYSMTDNPRGTILGDLESQAKHSKVLKSGWLGTYRDFMTIDELGKLVGHLIGKIEDLPRVYLNLNVCTGQPQMVRELVERRFPTSEYEIIEEKNLVAKSDVVYGSFDKFRQLVEPK